MEYQVNIIGKICLSNNDRVIIFLYLFLLNNKYEYITIYILNYYNFTLIY